MYSYLYVSKMYVIRVCANEGESKRELVMKEAEHHLVLHFLLRFLRTKLLVRMRRGLKYVRVSAFVSKDFSEINQNVENFQILHFTKKKAISSLVLVYVKVES